MVEFVTDWSEHGTRIGFDGHGLLFLAMFPELKKAGHRFDVGGFDPLSVPVSSS